MRNILPPPQVVNSDQPVVLENTFWYSLVIASQSFPSEGNKRTAIYFPVDTKWSTYLLLVPMNFCQSTLFDPWGLHPSCLESVISLTLHLHQQNYPNERTEILPYLKADKLDCHNFKTLGRKKNFLRDKEIYYSCQEQKQECQYLYCLPKAPFPQSLSAHVIQCNIVKEILVRKTESLIMDHMVAFYS